MARNGGPPRVQGHQRAGQGGGENQEECLRPWARDARRDQASTTSIAHLITRWALSARFDNCSSRTWTALSSARLIAIWASATEASIAALSMVSPSTVPFFLRRLYRASVEELRTLCASAICTSASFFNNSI